MSACSMNTVGAVRGCALGKNSACAVLLRANFVSMGLRHAADVPFGPPIVFAKPTSLGAAKYSRGVRFSHSDDITLHGFGAVAV